MPTRHIIGHFRDESFQAINCTETEKTALANKTIYTLIRYGFYYLRSGNGVGAILTAPEPTRGRGKHRESVNIPDHDRASVGKCSTDPHHSWVHAS